MHNDMKPTFYSLLEKNERYEKLSVTDKNGHRNWNFPTIGYCHYNIYESFQPQNTLKKNC